MDLTFPHLYEVELTQEFPGSGPPEFPTIYIPTPTRRMEHDGLWVTLSNSDGKRWNGVFAYGFSGPFPSRVMSSPDPERLIVIASGAAYWVSAHDSADWQLPPTKPVTDAIAIAEHSIIVLASFDRLAAYGPNGLKWTTPALVPDCLKIGGVKGGILEGAGYDPGSDTGVVHFAVDLSTGGTRAV